VEGLSADEQVELGELLAKRDEATAGANAVQLRVEPPHSAITYGGLTVTTEPTTVPGDLAAGIVSAAGEAGVTITQET